MKRRICIVMGGHFSATIGGAQYQAKCIVEYLVAQGDYDIYYLARAVRPDFEPDGYKILQIANPDGINRFSFSLDTPQLLRTLKRLEPDVVYQRGLKAHTGIVAYYGRNARNTKTIFHISSDVNVEKRSIRGIGPSTWLQRIDRAWEEYGMRNIDCIVAQTADQSAALERNFGRKATRILPNFHPVPDDDAEKPDSPIRVVWVANLKKIKQPETFVDLARSLRDYQNIRFTMIGRPGPGRYAELHSQIEELPNIEFLGELPLEEVNDILSSSHILVNTSLAEGFPNTFIQAWMRRVPTLSLTVNPDSVFDAGEIGFCTGSFEALREKIILLAENPRQRANMGESARAHALRNHSSGVVRDLESLFG